MATFGITDSGFTLKRLADILADMVTALNTVTDPVTGESLTPNLADENDPFIQQIQATADAVSECWEQLQLVYNQFDPLQASGSALSGLVQLSGLTRIADETDAALRVRQQESTTAVASGMLDDCYAAIKALTGVTFARIYQNVLTVEDSRGLPPKSISALVVGGSAINICTALFNHTPICNYFGNVELPIVDTQGVEYFIRFSRPINVPIYVKVTCVVTNAALWPSDGTTQIKTAMVNYAANGASAIGITSGFDQVGISPGDPVYATELAIPANSVAGMRILSIYIGTTYEGVNQAVVSIPWNYMATIIDTVDANGNPYLEVTA